MHISETMTAHNHTATSAEDKKSERATGDFQTFLSLLTAQMRNQDPLKPMESTEFVAQLASFSSVEQQIETNKKLDEIASGLTSSSIERFASWLGNDVRRSGSTVFEGNPLDVGVSIHQDADYARLVIRDEALREMASIEISADTNSVTWDGFTSEGVIADYGRYFFEIESHSNNDALPNTAGIVFDKVVEVRRDNGNILLVFGDGKTVSASDVSAVRTAQIT